MRASSADALVALRVESPKQAVRDGRTVAVGVEQDLDALVSAAPRCERCAVPTDGGLAVYGNHDEAVLREAGGGEELVAGLPLTLRVQAGSKPLTARYATAFGVRPKARIDIPANRTIPGSFILNLQTAGIGLRIFRLDANKGLIPAKHLDRGAGL